MSLEKLRSLPEFQNASDAEILGALSKTAGVPLADVASAFGADTGGKWGNRLSASIDSYQAGLYGVGEALTGSEPLRNRRTANEAEAELARSLAQRQGAIMSYKDVGGFGDAVDFVGGLAVNSLPYAAEALVGGLTGGTSLVAGNAARMGISRGAARTLGGVAASYPSSVGDILQNQREENGTTNVGAALAGGVPYAALNALGIEGALARGTLTRSGIKTLDGMTGLRGGLARTGVSMLKNAAVEGPSETGQELINQSFGRMAVNPDQTLFNPEANERYAESFVGGAALGGVFGGAAGGWRRSEGYLPSGQNVDNPEKPADLLGGQRLDPDAQYGLQGDLFDGAGYDTQTNGSRAAGVAAPETVEALRSDLGQLTAMAEEAYQAGDRDGLEQINLAIQQTQQRISQLETREPQAGQEDFFSGVYRMNGSGPAEMSTIEARNAAAAERPFQSLLPETVAVDSMGNVAGSEADNALINDPGAQVARQQWLDRQRQEQEIRQKAEETRAEVERRRTRAAEYGLKGDKLADTLAEMDQLLADKVITPAQFAENLGLLQANKRGSVEKFLKGIAAQTDAVATSDAAEKQANLDKLQKNANVKVPAETATAAAPAGGLPSAGGNLAVETAGAIAGIDPEKKTAIGRKGREKEVNAAQLVQLMRNATPIEKARIAAATGLEATADPTTGAPRLVQLGEPQTLDAIAEAESRATGKKVSREAIRLSLVKFGITPSVIDQLQGVAADTVTEAELGIDPESDGSGFRVESQLSKTTGQGLVEGDGETKAQRETREKADELLKQAGPPTALTTADGATPTNLPAGATVVDLREGNQSRVASNTRAILNSPEAGNASADWDSESAAWDEVPDSIKADWIAAYVDNLRLNEGELNFEQLARDQKEIERAIADFRANAGRNSPGIAGPEGRQAPRSADGAAAGRGGKRLGQNAETTIDVQAREVSPTKVNQDVLGGPPDLPINNDVIERDPPDTRAGRRNTALGEAQEVTSGDGKVSGAMRRVTDKAELERTNPGFAAATERMRALGLGHVVDGVEIFIAPRSAFPDPRDRGAFTSVDGSLAIILRSDLLTAPAQGELRWATLHEMGHAVDFIAAANGYVSNGAPWAVRVVDGKVQGTGVIARELIKLGETNEGVKKLLKYPLDETDLSPQEISNELFAQAFFLHASGKITLPKAVVASVQGATNVTKATSAKPRLRGQNQGDARLSRPAGVSGVGGEAAREGPQTRAARAAAPNTRKSIIEALPYAMQDFLKSRAYEISNFAIKGSFTEDILARLAKQFEPAKTYLREIQKVMQERNRRELEVSEILKAHSGLTKAERGTGAGSVNQVLRDSTYSGRWAFKPDWLPADKYTYDANSAEAKAYNALSKEAKAVVQQVFRHGHESLQAMKAAVKANIEAEFPNDPDKARKAYNDYVSVVAVADNKPYAPLRRFGKYVVVAKSQAYQAAEKAGDTALVRELEKNGDHYYVAFRETKTEQEALARELGNVFTGDSAVTQFERMEEGQVGYGQRDIISGMNRLRKMVREDTDLDGKLTKKARDSVDSMMQQIYLTMLAETSARKGEIHRRNIAGADNDMMRAFATRGMAQAQFIANLQADGKADLALADVASAVRKTSGEQRQQAQALYNEVLRRRSLDMEYTNTPMLDKAMAASSTYLLMTNPSYYVVNATQPWMMSLPVMAARYGQGRSVTELFRAYDGITKVVKGGFTPESFKKLPADVQGAVQALAERGRINISLALDLGKFQSEKSGTSAFVEKTMGVMRSAAESVESVNRVATAVAAYRLAKQAGETDARAIDFAEQVISETHGDYSAWNAPRFMRSGVGRLATQFRKFQLIQLSMFARFVSRWMDGDLSPEERSIARTAFMYNIGLLAAMGGLAGLPGASAVMFLAGALGWGDDETPDDWEASFRRAVGNKELADLMWYGGPKLLGVNLSGRVGAGDMLSLIPKTDVELSRDGYYEILAGFAGPLFGGVLPRAVDGLGLMRQGDYRKGVEQLLPGGIANALKAARFGDEGITRRNGDVVMSADELAFLDTFMQAIGLPTNQITDRNSLASAQFKADEFYQARTTQLKKDYTKAARANDSAARREVIEAWMRTQEARRQLGYKPQPLADLMKAPKEQAKRERAVAGGVAFKQGNEGFTRSMAELY